MTVSDKVSYLKGLADGLGLDKDSKEGKLFAAVIDTLDAIACQLEGLEESVEEITDEVDAISEDLEDLENYVFDEDEDEDDDEEELCCPSHCGGCHGSDDEDEDEDEEDEYVYSVTCPNCDTEFSVDEQALVLGEVACPSCGENLEFEFDEDDEAEEEKE
ncbi:MAG: hypothetical protein IJC35_01845 [Oscillospiraceae bacterium]|nr:hypothetical protein [Oscillospiraceae bacterium]